MAKLILVRHGKSEWNKQGLWTGHTDIDLAEEGHEEARQAGHVIRDIDVHHAHVSMLKRAQQTLQGILASLGKVLEPKPHAALNERHYGIHTGKNKWEVKEAVGEEMFQQMRRGWDVAIPEGETLKDVHARVVPHYESEILPLLKAGENVLVVSHGNTLRALIKHLEGLDDASVCDVEVGTGEVHCYEIDANGRVLGKEIRSLNESKLKT